MAHRQINFFLYSLDTKQVRKNWWWQKKNKQKIDKKCKKVEKLFQNKWRLLIPVVQNHVNNRNGITISQLMKNLIAGLFECWKS